MSVISALLNCEFQSTPSVGRATSQDIQHHQELSFQSTPSVGRATIHHPLASILHKFQSTPSVGRATARPCALDCAPRGFQSTPSVGRATQVRRHTNISVRISIHALRGEGDHHLKREGTSKRDFNPRPPWGGRRWYCYKYIQKVKFQSTPSVGRATISSNKIRLFSIISIHALRGEGDNCQQEKYNRNKKFQSTPSVGRATRDGSEIKVFKIFQSTPSVGRATLRAAITKMDEDISIHALRGEGDFQPIYEVALPALFQSTPSVGRATFDSNIANMETNVFQSTPSVGRATISLHSRRTIKRFQSTPSVGRATQC